MRDFWSGLDPGEHGRRRDRRLEWSSSSASTSRAVEHAGAVEPDVAAHLGRDQAVVAGDDLDLHAQPLELGDRRRRRRPWAVGEGQESRQHRAPSRRPMTSAAVALGASGWRRRRPGPLGEQRVEGRDRAASGLDAPGEDRLGGALGDDQRAVGGVDQHRRPFGARGRRAATPSRRTARPSPARSRRPRAPTQSAWSRALPPTGPRSVTVDSLQTRPEAAGRSSSCPSARGRSKVMVPSVSVPVLSVKRISMLPRSSIATSRFTSTFFVPVLRTGRQAHRDDRRHHLGRDPHGDGQREQQGLDQGPRQRHVDGEDGRR